MLVYTTQEKKCFACDLIGSSISEYQVLFTSGRLPENIMAPGWVKSLKKEDREGGEGWEEGGRVTWECLTNLVQQTAERPDV